MLIKKTENPRVLQAAAALSLKEEPQRLSASLCVISSKDSGRVLVVHRKKDGELGLPCGKVDSGEITLEAAYRELEEETGISKWNILDGLDYIQDINFEGCIVSVFKGEIPIEIPVGPSKGHEYEGKASWMSVKGIEKTPGRFQDFNIVAIFNAGL